MRVLYNAKIRTNNAQQPAVQALAIDHGRVIAAGGDAAIRDQHPGAEQIDMHGQVIWPGLTDAHIHLHLYSFALKNINCETPTRDECLRLVAEKTRQVRPNEWIQGFGWNQHNWVEGFGTSTDLDAVAPAHPVYLVAKSGHAGWANSAALRAAGITRASVDPQGGKIGRFEDGSPNGLLFETAMELVEKAIPVPTDEEVAESLDSAQETLFRVGITSVHDYDRRQCFSALQMLQQRGRLRLRVIKSIPLEDLEQAVAIGLRTGFGNDVLRIGSVKLFADGALGPRTAAMLQPYENDRENTGILLLDNEQIFEYGQQATSHGISMAIHAIGDRANHEVLLAYEQLRRYEREHNLPPLRHRIEHVQVLHPDDYGQLAGLDIIASVQPIHATSDMYAADKHWGSRSAGAYAFRMLIERGTRVAFGSDSPVELPNPFLGLHAAVTRQRPDGSPGDSGWYPDQRLSLEQALHGFTTGPAYAAGLENQMGQLAPGFLADLIVLEQNPFSQPASQLHAVQPLATMIGGEWVWQQN